MSTEVSFTADELREIARRAFVLAKDADTPAMRIALGLFGESAENLAKRIPQPPAEPAGEPAEPPAAAPPAKSDEPPAEAVS